MWASELQPEPGSGVLQDHLGKPALPLLQLSTAALGRMDWLGGEETELLFLVFGYVWHQWNLLQLHPGDGLGLCFSGKGRVVCGVSFLHKGPFIQVINHEESYVSPRTVNSCVLRPAIAGMLACFQNSDSRYVNVKIT